MGLVPQAVIDTYNTIVDSFINEDFGVDCVLEYPPKDAVCINCVYDSKSKKSTNRYKSGGPSYFTSGVCPWCGGKGVTQTINTDTIKLRCYWERKSWLKIGIPINIPDNAVQTIGFLSDFPKIKKAQKILLNNQNSGYVNLEYVLYGEPIPHGFKKNRYIICYWVRA